MSRSNWWANANGGRGAHWIKDKKRLLIYERDEHRCLWCLTPCRRYDNATLDHLVSRDRGGNNHSSNIFLACAGCNSRRQHRSAAEFAAELGDPEALNRIAEHLARPIPMREVGLAPMTRQDVPF